MMIKIEFDRLEWSFICHTLIHFNFPPPLIELIMSCVTSSTTFILLNSSPTQAFKSSRGIRQGDPLSPYLFILCMEMFSESINLVGDYQSWDPIYLTKHAPPISYFFFADDIILTAMINTHTRHSIIVHINYFTSLSGQQINFQKSNIFFSKLCPSDIKLFVTTSFNMPEGRKLGKYLGFSLLESKPSKRDFQFLLDNFRTRLAGWTTIFLSMAGRTTLIKATLNSIPNHVMQITYLPIQILNQLERYQGNF